MGKLAALMSLQSTEGYTEKTCICLIWHHTGGVIILTSVVGFGVLSDRLLNKVSEEVTFE